MGPRRRIIRWGDVCCVGVPPTLAEIFMLRLEALARVAAQEAPKYPATGKYSRRGQGRTERDCKAGYTDEPATLIAKACGLCDEGPRARGAEPRG
jgi:hypothetical protein